MLSLRMEKCPDCGGKLTERVDQDITDCSKCYRVWTWEELDLYRPIEYENDYLV